MVLRNNTGGSSNLVWGAGGTTNTTASLANRGFVGTNAGLDGLSLIASKSGSDIRFYAGSFTNIVGSWSATALSISSGVALKLGNAYTAGAPTPTGYVVIQDSNGTSYKIPAEAV